ncbi:hypothetical protein BOTBODRAFT_176419 [Botryobasidium botryosum FD-172 SS1]|uniref:Uncharacterized protein n=1 Tax=Botryobasidium botryosum (strain FD-172 SS1) TaxID=930990 RepID=A0A067MCP5_BOTB1|nr:hypothetical protein BOTBODRAFT_176419 [Botryobasidium botryosum FD-172 SS1]
MKAELSVQVKPLPPDVSVDKICADFIGYLYGQTRIYFYDHIIDGERAWKAQKTSIDFVVAHPNGWANLVSPEKVAREKIKFVSEAEASVHLKPEASQLPHKPTSSLAATSNSPLMPSQLKSFEDTLWKEDSKLVIAFDIGTTYAAVAFVHLYKGGKKVIDRVTKWPGQKQAQQSKIPSKIYYDKNGQAQAFGAEVNLDENREKAEDEHWSLAEHWKLHLHPASMDSKIALQLDELPPGISLEKIYADFMAYLHRHTRNHFHTRIPTGAKIWNELEAVTEFIIAHPNGWGPTEQNFLRAAAVAANIVPSGDEAIKRLRFVSEAEASVHFITMRPDFQKELKFNLKLLVCDAGGSTVDTTLYTVDKVSPLYLREEKASACKCVQAGAMFVDRAAKAYFKDIFAKPNLDDEDREEYISQAVESFEANAKRSFEGPMEEKSITVGDTRTDINCDGGFGESPYLRNRIKAGAETPGIRLTIADGSTAKAVADGAIVWSIQGAVTARATRFAYGTEISVPVEPLVGEKIGRPVVLGPSGPRIEGGWSEIIPKHKVIEDKYETSEPFWVVYNTPRPHLSLFEETIYAYEGSEQPPPMFMRDRYGNLKPGFHKLCDIQVDLAKMRGGITSEVGQKGTGRYWILHFNTILTFGGTEIRAAVTWREKNNTLRSKASLVSSNFT